MRISTAMNMLQKKYAEALKLEGIRDPVAWALYQTWRVADTGRAKMVPETADVCDQKTREEES